MKKIVKALMTLILIVTSLNIMPVNATEVIQDSKQEGCNGTQGLVKKVTLLSDESYLTTRGQIGTVTVNKTFSIHIQNNSGTCWSSAKATVTGSYQVEVGNVNKVTNINLRTNVSGVPNSWTVNLSNQRYTAGSSTVTVNISYSSSVIGNNYDCMIGGGLWFSGAEFTV